MPADLKVGMEMELTTMPLFTDDDGVERVVYAWRIANEPEPLYILGAGMHPWGKWGNDFTEYGVAAARAALAEAGLDWRQIQLVAGADTIRNGYPGFVAGATFAQKLGWNGVPVSLELRGLRQRFAGAAERPRPDPGRVLRRRTGHRRRHHAQGLLRARSAVNARNDPDWQRFHLIGATNPVYFALLARRRMDLYGATLEDFAQVKVKNATPRAR